MKPNSIRSTNLKWICMHRINFILVLLHQRWVYYTINSFYNWTCFGVVRNLGVTSLFLQQSLLCLIGFMVCLNCSSPEDNRSLQCFKLNYRCCKVCSENDCKKGLLPPQQSFKTPNAEILALCVDGSGLGTGQPAEQSPSISETETAVSCFLCLHEKNFSWVPGVVTGLCFD